MIKFTYVPDKSKRTTFSTFTSCRKSCTLQDILLKSCVVLLLLVYVFLCFVGLYYLFRHIEGQSTSRRANEEMRCSLVNFPYCKYDPEFIPGCVPSNSTCVYDSRLGTHNRSEINVWWVCLGVGVGLIVCGGLVCGIYLTWGFVC